jgi:hypothetical protein
MAAPFSTVPALGSLGYLVTPAKPSDAQVFAEQKLSRVIPEDSRIVGSNYRGALRYGYYLGSHVYGRADQGYDVTDPRFQSVIRADGIDYYLLFTPKGAPVLDLSDLGPTLATFEQNVTCTDKKTAVIEDCRIDVIKVAP